MTLSDDLARVNHLHNEVRQELFFENRNHNGI
jgi:hypothetical protein